MEFNFVIFYTPGRENKKADSLAYWRNNCPVNDHDNWSQNLLSTILQPERLVISSIDMDKSEIIPEKIIQANLAYFY